MSINSFADDLGDFAPNKASKIKVSNFSNWFNTASPPTVQSALEQLASPETATTTNPGGSNTQVQFNDNSAFGGDAGFTYNKTTDYATLVGGLISPYVIGGTATTSDLNLQTTSGIGATGADMQDRKSVV